MVMIATFLIVGSAFYWLMYESDWLRVNLNGFTELELFDIKAMAEVWTEAFESDLAYKRYWDEIYNPSMATNLVTRALVQPINYDELDKRRSGMGIYRRSVSSQRLVERELAKW